jgi:hypothetical protein
LERHYPRTQTLPLNSPTQSAEPRSTEPANAVSASTLPSPATPIASRVPILWHDPVLWHSRILPRSPNPTTHQPRGRLSEAAPPSTPVGTSGPRNAGSSSFSSISTSSPFLLLIALRAKHSKNKTPEWAK